MKTCLKRRFIFSLLVLGISVQSLWAQSPLDYTIKIEAVNLEGLPGLQSFALGTYDGKWIFIGGRLDGLHRRQPWATFWDEDSNKRIYLVDPAENMIWDTDLLDLNPGMQEQLQSTNMEYTQVGNQLFLIGGYGYSELQEDHYTFPNLTAVDLEILVDAIITDNNIAGAFRQIEDDRMQVCGGYLNELGGFYYLVGGQKFIGRYNPMGPSHGPGFVQEYTDQIRKFKIIDDGIQLTIDSYSAITDSVNLHRRDFNMLPQIFPDGSRGFTVFSGVFQHDVDLPWLNTVDVHQDTYVVIDNFNQYLNQYHGAHMTAYDSNNNKMYSTFFGGISRYYFGENNELIDDPDVPFVTTISQVVRDETGNMSETKIGDMPALLGASASFIPASNIPLYENDIVDLNAMSGDSILLGYVFGGIESSAPNIFFINNGEESIASSNLYKVGLIPKTQSFIQHHVINDFVLAPNVSTSGSYKIRFELRQKSSVQIELYDNQGRQVSAILNEELPAGEHVYHIELSDAIKGSYHLRISDGRTLSTHKLIRN
jgi:hypothetical protein